MSKGKYSPHTPNAKDSLYRYEFNAMKQIPPDYKEGDTYNEIVHFANYDADGYDSYGYSAFDDEGSFVGVGNGVDRVGNTEHDYVMMSDDDWESI